MTDGRSSAGPRTAKDRGCPRRCSLPPCRWSGRGQVAGSLRAVQTGPWQKDAWYFYDAIGELRAPVNWVANAVSKASPFAAETDPETGLVTGPTEDARASVRPPCCSVEPAQRAQLQYVLALCWQVPGEAFVIIRPRSARRGVPQPDQWLVLAGDRVEVKGGSWQYIDPYTLVPVSLGPNDRLIRVWSPHPRDQAKADTQRPAGTPHPARDRTFAR